MVNFWDKLWDKLWFIVTTIALGCSWGVFQPTFFSALMRVSMAMVESIWSFSW